MFQALSVRPNERRDTWGAFCLLLLAVAGHAILETARDSLFLARHPATRLPWVYLGVVVTSLLFAWTIERGRARAPSRGALSGLLILVAAITVVFARAVRAQQPWSYYALYIWAGTVGTLIVVRFWSLIEDRFTVTQAKRLFALIGAGSVMGAVLGSALARGLASMGQATLLLDAAAVLFGLAAALPFVLHRAPALTTPSEEAPPEADLRRDLQEVVARPYVRRILLLLLVSSAALTFADYAFKSAVDDAILPEDLPRFFAGASLVFALLSLVMQLVGAGWILRVHGVSRSLALLPIALSVGSAGLALGGGLLAALLLKGVDGALRYSIHRTSVEVLYVPLERSERGRFKALLEVLGQRGGQLFASVALLLWAFFSLPLAVLGGVLLLLSAAWALLADALQVHYLELFRRTLPDVAARSRAGEPGWDLNSLESLLAALSSPDDTAVLTALNLLETRGKARLIPLLILYHPSEPVLLRALEIFTEVGREDLEPMAHRLLQHPSPEVRAAGLRTLARTRPGTEILRRALADRSPLVRLTGQVGLASLGGPTAEEARRELEKTARDGSDEERAALATAIGHRDRRSPEAAHLLLGLAGDPSPLVRRAVAHAMAHLPDPRFPAALVRLLASRELRPLAQSAFRAHGEAGIVELEGALGDARLPPRLRRQVPRTYAHIAPAERAGRMLLDRLAREEDGAVRYKLLRALGSLRRLHPGVPLDPAALDAQLERTLGVAFRTINWRMDLERGAREIAQRATPVHEFLVQLLHDKERHAIERIFRVLGLRHPGEDFYRIYRGLLTGDSSVRAGGIELLSELLVPPLRDAVLGLLDDADDERRLAVAGPFHHKASGVYSFTLYELIKRGGMTASTLAACHAGELGFADLRAEIRSLEVQASSPRKELLARALALLDLPDADRLRLLPSLPPPAEGPA